MSYIAWTIKKITHNKLNNHNTVSILLRLASHILRDGRSNRSNRAATIITVRFRCNKPARSIKREETASILLLLL